MPNQDPFDVVIVGSGGAGLRSAIEAYDRGASTLLVSNGMAGKSGATMMAGADITLDGSGAAEIGLPGNESDSKEKFFHDIIVQGYYLNNQKLVETYVRNAPARTKEMMDWGMKYVWDRKRAVLTQGTDLSKILMEQVNRRHIPIKNDFYVTDILTCDNSAAGIAGLDINNGSVETIEAKAVIIATGGWQRLYSFTSAPGGLTGAMHAAAYRVGAALLNMEMITFCPNVILWPPALRGDIFPYILIEMFGDLLDKHGRPFLRDEYDPLIYHIATTTEWNKLIFSVAATKIVARGDGSPRDGTYYSIKNVPVNIIEEAEKIYPGWRWLRTDFTSLIEWLKQGNAIEVAPAAHYMEGGIAVDEHASTTLKGLYAAGECSGGLFGSNRVASAITQILVQAVEAAKAATAYSKRVKPPKTDQHQLQEIESRLTAPLNRKDNVHVVELKKSIRKIADTNLWVIRNGTSLKKAIANLESIMRHDLPHLTVETQALAYNKEWIDAIEIQNTLPILLASAKSALLRTESRGVHNRSDFPQTDNKRWLREIVIRQRNGRMSVTTRPITITKLKPPRIVCSFEEGIIRAVKGLSG